MKMPPGSDRDEQEALRELEQPLETLRARHLDDPPIELLRAARAEVLPEGLQDDVSRHLAESAWSRALVDGASLEEAVLDNADQARLLQRIQKQAGELARRHSMWGWLRHPAFATAAAAVIVAAGVLAWESRSPRSHEPLPAQIADATTSVPRAPAFRLPLEAPTVRLSVAVLTWRGTGNQNRLLTDLKPGLDAFRNADYATANTELSRVAAAYPDSFDVRYYQGLSRLLIHDASGAIESLTAAEPTADTPFAPDVAWYLAVAHERAGNLEEVRKRLTPLCQSGTTRAADACAALSQIK